MNKVDRDRLHWMTWGFTSILLKKDETNLMYEWQPVGRLVLRQIYEKLPKQWHAYVCGRDLTPDTLIGTFTDWLEAQTAIENCCNAPDKPGLASESAEKADVT